jgi:hypothetical protein
VLFPIDQRRFAFTEKPRLNIPYRRLLHIPLISRSVRNPSDAALTAKSPVSAGSPDCCDIGPTNCAFVVPDSRVVSS